jgi:hypothetical protein
MAEISKRDAEEELRRRGILTGGTRSVLEQPEQTTSLEEVKRFTQSLLKGSAKGIIDLVGGYGNLYDYIKKNPEPSGLSSRGIVNAISNLGGPDLMKLQGYKGAYDIGQAGAPAALMGAVMPAGSLFSGTTGTAARAGKEFAAGGTIGLLGQQVAPESPYAQLTLQTLPYLVKGGISGLKERKQQQLLNEYKSLLPEKDLGIFNDFVLKGQGSTDPAIAADIARLTRSPKYLEMVTALNEGATVKALQGMAPKGSPLTPEQSKTGIIQAIQNKLAGIRESNADSLFEKAKGYGAGQGLVDSSQTVAKIDGLINRYSAQSTPNAERAVQVLQSIRDRLAPSFMTEGGGGTTVTRAGTPDINIPGSKGYTINETGQPSRTTQGAPARTVTEEVVVTKTDALGMPYQTTEIRTRQVPAVPSFTEAGSQGRTINVPGSAGTTIAGTPDVNMNIPGANPYRIQQGPRKLTVEEVQGLLSEFGKKASAGDNLIKDLSISDERIISSAIFGGLKDDMATALKGATGSDKAALNLLNTARERVAKASTAYNEAISQGMPSFLHNKSLAEISPEDLYKTYMGLTPAQRGTMRSWVGSTDQAALDVLDKQVFTDFVNQAKKTNNLGVETVDLASLAQNWRALEKIPGAQDALVTALGTNASEFGQRMKDAELFTRKMSVSQAAPDQAFTPAQVRETQAAIGGVAGYGPAKIGQLAMDTLNTITNTGLSEEQLMKVLLTDSGKNFLKSASLSPRSEKALTDLMAVDQTPLEALGKFAVGTAARLGPRIGAAEQPMMAPTETMVQQPQEQPQITPEQALEELKARGIPVQ